MKAEIQSKTNHLLNTVPSTRPKTSLIREAEVPLQPVSLESSAQLGHRFGAISIQPKLTIGPVNDQYEQEADRVAAQVVRQVNEPSSQQPAQRMGAKDEDSLRMKQAKDVQRQDLPEEEEEELQPKLVDSSVQRQEMPEEEEEELQPKLTGDPVQRQEVPEEEEEELQLKSDVQRQAIASVEAAPELEESIQQARGGGQGLAENVRTPMERSFGADFSRVKVHTDARADQLSQSIQARAFTTGQDIFMRQGEFSTRSRSGQELLAHELTHVVQQNREVAE